MKSTIELYELINLYMNMNVACLFAAFNYFSVLRTLFKSQFKEKPTQHCLSPTSSSSISLTSDQNRPKCSAPTISFPRSLSQWNKRMPSSSLGFCPRRAPWPTNLSRSTMEDYLLMYHSCGNLSLVLLNTSSVKKHFLLLLLHLLIFPTIPTKSHSRSTQDPIFYVSCS